MKDNEIINLYWNRDGAVITATADTCGNYCYSIVISLQIPKTELLWGSLSK